MKLQPTKLISKYFEQSKNKFKYSRLFGIIKFLFDILLLISVIFLVATYSLDNHIFLFVKYCHNNLLFIICIQSINCLLDGLFLVSIHLIKQNNFLFPVWPFYLSYVWLIVSKLLMILTGILLFSSYHSILNNHSLSLCSDNLSAGGLKNFCSVEQQITLEMLSFFVYFVVWNAIDFAVTTLFVICFIPLIYLYSLIHFVYSYKGKMAKLENITKK